MDMGLAILEIRVGKEFDAAVVVFESLLIFLQVLSHFKPSAM
jgi:hypothetical protein